ncbi:MAG: hypothetical protein J7J91_08575 [Deltaproteobacteria bacterium]|nr:hypothetical protein [Deltaproteobacteria bacterium]
MATPTWTERIRKHVVETFTSVSYSTGGVLLHSKILPVVEEAAVLEIAGGGGTIYVGNVTAVGMAAGTIPNAVKVYVAKSVGTAGVSEVGDGETISKIKLLLGGS